MCVRGIGRSCGCEICEATTSRYVDWLGNIVEEEDEYIFPWEGDDDWEDDEAEDDEETEEEDEEE